MCPVGVAGARGQSTARTVTERADLRRRWLHQLAALADRPNVSVKLSGFAMPILGYNETATREQLWQVWGPALSEIITMFGADRVMFGSNSPIDAAVATYHDLVAVVADAVVAAAGEQALPGVFAGNARAFYRLPA